MHSAATSPPVGPVSAGVPGPGRPGTLAIGPDGNIYIADDNRREVLARRADGSGTGHAGFSGDGGPATRAALNDPAGMRLAADGSLYLADSANNRIRGISTGGIISTWPNGTAGWVTNGMPALRAPLANPHDIAFGPGGALYIAAGGSNQVLRMGPGGRLTIVAGSQIAGGGAGIAGPAATASPDEPSSLAFDSAGNLYIFGFADKSLLVVTPGGTMTEPVFEGFYPGGDGGLAAAPDGSVIAMDGESIVRLRPSGTTTLVDFSSHPAPGISHFQPNGIAVGPAGEIYADTFEGNGFADRSALIRVDPSGHQTVLWEPGTKQASPSPSPTLAGPVLGADGLGVVSVGDPQAAAVATMTKYLGAPTTTTPGDCSGTTEVQWHDLSLEFSGGSLAGYRYLRGLPMVGSTNPPTSGPGTPLLKTATGATLGSTLAQVGDLYPPNDFSMEQGGAIVVTGASPGNRLFLGFFDKAPAAQLSEIKGGGTCGDF